jgi:hypothetical protein
MSALSVIRRGLIGIAAVALPFVALGSAVFSIAFGDATLYFAVLGVAYLAVGGMAWTCVRGAGFSPRLAMFLTALPFGILALVSLPVRYGDNGAGLLISLGQFALALLVAWWAASRLARKR